MNVLDLFSGIGGFSLGLERAGMRTVGFCEIDPYCRRVLAKHWPGVPCHDDIRTLAPITADVVCGGFPCQDISEAGRGAGLGGDRSGLWREQWRIIRDSGCRYAIVENVAALLHRGLGEVLRDLAEIGFYAEWHCIPAAYVGAPHRRDRIWIVAYAGRIRGEARARTAAKPQGRADPHAYGENLADAAGERLERRSQAGHEIPTIDWGLLSAGHGEFRNAWAVEPDVGRVAHGVPARVDRLRALGNSVVPQVVEMIGRAIMASSDS